MDQEGRGSSGIPTNWWVALIALVVGGLFYSKLSFEGARPSSLEEIKRAPFTAEDVQARLWEDPFAAVHRYVKESDLLDTSIHTNARLPFIDQVIETDGRRDTGAHSITAVIKRIAEKNRKKLAILGVMVDAGPYSEDAENRLRTRYGVLSALLRMGYVPDNPEHVGYMHIRERDYATRGANLELPEYIPYEWFVGDGNEDRGDILVMWLDEKPFQGQFLKGIDQYMSVGKISLGEFVLGKEIANCLDTAGGKSALAFEKAISKALNAECEDVKGTTAGTKSTFLQIVCESIEASLKESLRQAIIPLEKKDPLRESLTQAMDSLGDKRTQSGKKLPNDSHRDARLGEVLSSSVHKIVGGMLLPESDKSPFEECTKKFGGSGKKIDVPALDRAELGGFVLAKVFLERVPEEIERRIEDSIKQIREKKESDTKDLILAANHIVEKVIGRDHTKLIEEFRRSFGETVVGKCNVPLIEFKILGPSSSTSLGDVIEEIAEYREALKTRKNEYSINMRSIEIYSPRATAADESVLSLSQNEEEESQNEERKYCFISEYCREGVVGGGKDTEVDECSDCVHLLRTIATDDVLTDELVDELVRRGVDPQSDRIVLISERDTTYARMLPKAFIWSVKKKGMTDMDKEEAPDDNEMKHLLAAAKVYENIEPNVYKHLGAAINSVHRLFPARDAEIGTDDEQKELRERLVEEVTDKVNLAEEELSKFNEVCKEWNEDPKLGPHGFIERGQETLESAIEELNGIKKHISEAAKKSDLIKKIEDAEEKICKSFDQVVNEYSSERIDELSYLRGLDGELPYKTKEGRESEEERKDRDKGPVFGAIERPEGLSQLDYLRRMAEQLGSLEVEEKGEEGFWLWLRERVSGKHKIKAVGVLGNDVYDKLLVFQALRNRFPDAIFFTTDLDSSMLHPDQYKWTRNLIIASSFGLQLHPELQDSVPPFRDSYQTSLFFTTLLAFDSKTQGRSQANLNKWFKPVRIFEVGRSGAFDLSLEGKEGDIRLDCIRPKVLESIHPPRPDLPGFSKDWVIWSKSHNTLGALVVGLSLFLGFIPIYIKFFSIPFPTKRNEPPEVKYLDSHKWFIGPAIVLGAALFVCILSQGSKGEPWALFQGISTWPTEFLVILSILLSLYYLRSEGKKLTARKEEISDLVGDKTNLWKTGTEVAGDLRINDSLELWKAYCKRLNLGTRLRRIILLSVSGFLLCSLTIYLFGFAQSPFRGEGLLSDLFRGRLLFAIAFFWLIVLLVWVLDTTIQTAWLTYSLSQYEFNWPGETIQRFGRRLDRLKDDVDRFIDITVIARISEIVDRQFYCPFLVMGLLVFAHNNRFDNWHLSLGGGMIILVFLGFLTYCSVVIRILAKPMKEAALKELQKKDIEAKGHGNEELTKQIASMIHSVTSVKQGAFVLFFQQSWVRVVLGGSVLVLVEYFTRM